MRSEGMNKLYWRFLKMMRSKISRNFRDLGIDNCLAATRVPLQLCLMAIAEFVNLKTKHKSPCTGDGKSCLDETSMHAQLVVSLQS
jgi:hypothetical protein